MFSGERHLMFGRLIKHQALADAIIFLQKSVKLTSGLLESAQFTRKSCRLLPLQE